MWDKIGLQIMVISFIWKTVYSILRISEEHKHWHYDRLSLNFIHAHMENVKSQAWWWGKGSVLPGALVKVRGILAGNRENTLKIQVQDTNNVPPSKQCFTKSKLTPQNGLWLIFVTRTWTSMVAALRSHAPLSPCASVKSRRRIATPCWRAMMLAPTMLAPQG